MFDPSKKKKRKQEHGIKQNSKKHSSLLKWQSFGKINSTKQFDSAG
jgi:hypothetical protein